MSFTSYHRYSSKDELHDPPSDDLLDNQNYQTDFQKSHYFIRGSQTSRKTSIIIKGIRSSAIVEKYTIHSTRHSI